MRSLAVAVLLVLLVFAAPSTSWGQSCPDDPGESAVRGFVTGLPAPDAATLSAGGGEPYVCSEWRPIISIPALKITQSNRADAQVDAFLLTSVGGGLSWQKLRWDPKAEKYESIFTVSPLTVLLSGQLSGENALDLSWAGTIGFFNNIFMLGGGYDFGSVKDRSRWFGLLSIGVNFNN